MAKTIFNTDSEFLGTITGTSIANATGDIVTIDGFNILKRRTYAEILTDLGGPYVDLATNQYTIGGEKTFTGAVQLFNGRVGVQTPVFGGSRLGDAGFQTPAIDTQAINFKDAGQLTATAMFATAVGGSDGYTFTTKNFVDDVLVWSINGVGAATYGGVGREVESTLGLRNDFTGGQFTVLDMFNQDYDAATEVANSSGWVAIHGGGATAKEIGLWRYDTTTYTPIWELSPANIWNFGIADVQIQTNQIWHAGNFTDNSTNWNAAFGWGDHAGLYLEVDGTNAMTNNLNMGSFSITAASGITINNSIFAGSDNVIIDFDSLNVFSLGIFAEPQLRYNLDTNTWTIDAEEIVVDNDARLTDARTPLAHTHLLADVTDVTATAAELNLLDLAGLTAGWVLSADTATTASWKAPTGGGGAIGGSITDNQIAVGATTADDIEGSANLTWDLTTLLVEGAVQAEAGYVSAKRVAGTADTHITSIGNSGTANNFLVGGSTTGSTTSMDTYLRIRSIADGDLTFQENSLAHKIWHEGNLTPTDYVLKAGDVMTGDLTVNAKVLVPNAAVNDWAFRADTNDVNYSGLWFTSAGDGMLILRDSLGANTQLTYNATINGLNATGNINSEGSYYYGDSKIIAQFSDAWLRLNSGGDFTNGIYCGSSIVRTDGSLQVGGSGSMFHATTTGVVSSAISMTSVTVTGTTSLVAGNNGVQNGTFTLDKADTGGVALAYEDDYYRWRRGGAGTISGFRWDNFDSQVMKLTSSGSVLTLGTDVATTGAVHAGDFIAGNQIINYGVGRWNVSEADTAHQRCDARDDATTHARLHWYGVDSLGVTKNFRHAWYDGNNYVNIDYDADVLSFDSDTSPFELNIRSTVDCGIHIEADVGNSVETDNPYLKMSQDGDLVNITYALEGTANSAYTGSLDNQAYVLMNQSISRYSIAMNNTTAGDLRLDIDKTTGMVFNNELGTQGTWITMDSSGAGSNTGEQSAGITLGESGYKGAAAIHMTYTGDGRGYIGMGAVTAGVPQYMALKFQYTNNQIELHGNLEPMTGVDIDYQYTGGVISRSVTNTGFLEGSYNRDGSTTTSTGAIYVMGGSYHPTATDLGNMYGVGYCYGAALNGVNGDLGTTPSNQWGMYVAADGEARLWFNASAGISRQKGAAYASNHILNSDERAKNSIKDYNPDGLEILWKEFELNSEKGVYRVGVIAQDLLKTNPEFVDAGDPDNLTVKYMDLHSAALAKKDKEIEDLTARMERLELIIKELI